MVNYDIIILWDPNTEEDFDFYKVYCSATPGGPYALIGTTKSPGFIHKDIPEGNTLYYTISAVDKQGLESAKSAEIVKTSPPDTTAPAAPTNLTARGLEDWSGVELFWSRTDDLADLKGYLILRSFDGITYDIIGTSTKPYYKDTNIPLGLDTTYHCTFCVYAVASFDKYFNVSVPDGPTTIFTIPLLQKVSASIDYLSLNVNWQTPRPEDNVSTVTVYYKKKVDSIWTMGSTVDWPTSRVRIDGPLDKNTEYDVALNVNSSVYPQINWLRVIIPDYDEDTTTPTNPLNVKGRADPDTKRCYLAWDRVAIDDDFLYYRIKIGTVIHGKTSDNTYTINNADQFAALAGDNLYIYVAAVDRAGNVSSESSCTVRWYDVNQESGTPLRPAWMLFTMPARQNKFRFLNDVEVDFVWNDASKDDPEFDRYFVLQKAGAYQLSSTAKVALFTAGWDYTDIVRETPYAYMNHKFWQETYVASPHSGSQYFSVGVVCKYGKYYTNFIASNIVEVESIDTTAAP